QFRYSAKIQPKMWFLISICSSIFVASYCLVRFFKSLQYQRELYKSCRHIPGPKLESFLFGNYIQIFWKIFRNNPACNFGPGVTNVTVPLRGDLSNSLARAITDGRTDNEPAACDKRHRTGKQQED